MRTLLLGGLLALAVFGAGCMGGGGTTSTVSATDNQFTPNSLSLKQNDEVKWTHDGANPHTVTIHKAGDPLTTTKKDTNLAAGTSTTYTFEETGTFHVYCTYHSQGAAGQFNSGMVMTVTVA